MAKDSVLSVQCDEAKSPAGSDTCLSLGTGGFGNGWKWELGLLAPHLELSVTSQPFGEGKGL